MKKFLLIVVLFSVSGLVLAVEQEKQAPLLQIDDNRLSQIMPDILVQARVVSTVEEKHCFKSELEVTRVFIGNISNGIRFFHNDSKVSYDPRIPGPILKKGETGIWMLQKTDHGVFAIMQGGAATYGLRFPLRHGISSRYKQVKSTVEAIEKIVKADSKDRVQLLKGYAKSRIPEVSMVAVNTMGGLGDEGLMNYLQNLLSDKKLGVATQVVIDRWLSDRKRKEAKTWQNSSIRKELLQKLVASKLDEYEARQVRGRIDRIAQHPGSLDDEAILNLMRVGVENEKIPVSVRRNYLRSVRWFSRRSGISPEFFEFLVELVRDNKNDYLRQQAVYAINNCSKLEDNQIAELDKLIKGLQDEKIIKALKEAIAKQQKTNKQLRVLK